MVEKHKKVITHIKSSNDTSASLGDCAVSYDIVKRWCRIFNCGNTYEDGGNPFTNVNEYETINKRHDIVTRHGRTTIEGMKQLPHSV